jgi:hypothetical protein
MDEGRSDPEGPFIEGHGAGDVGDVEDRVREVEGHPVSMAGVAAMSLERNGG